MTRRTIALALAATILLLMGAFGLGILVGHYEWSPYDRLRKLRGLAVEMFRWQYPDLRQAPNVDVGALISVHSQADIQRVRAKLVEHLWSGKGFPTAKQPTISDATGSEAAALGVEAAKVLRLDTEMEYGFNSIAYHYQPRIRNGKVVIFQQGHAAERVHDSKVIEFFLRHGYDVIFIDMLMQNGNRKPTIDTPPYGRLTFKKHDQLKFLESRQFNPVKLFLEPVAAAVNYATQSLKAANVAMLGLSGGGWITSMYAAIDPRITYSFPIAGTVPMYLRFAYPDTNWGDYEQTQPALTAIASELDLYAMASSGPGRKQLQVFNLNDPCCYAGRAPTSYAPYVQRAVSQIGPGAFEVHIDETTFEHEVSTSTLELIHSVIGAGSH